MKSIIKKVKDFSDEINGRFCSYEKDFFELDGVVAQAIKANHETGKQIVFTGYCDGTFKTTVSDIKPNVNEWRKSLSQK